tara:strand:- start:408 stop:1364 length:957 start_codon:yes stop_codon:yes gene_type:complete
MPTFLGAGRAGIIGGAGPSGPYGTQENPITNDAEGALWVTSNGGNSGPAYVQKAGLNGGNPYEVYCVYSSNKLWVMAGVFAGNDSTNSSSGNGFFRWAPCESPSSTSNNDWGTLTHTFNDNYDFSAYSQNNRSARSRAWAELATNRSRFYFFNQTQTSKLIYSFTSSSAGGENASWGTRMETVSDYFRIGSGTVSVAANDIVGSVPSGTLQDTRWARLGLGASDGENANANTQDVIMLVAQGTTSQGTSTDWGNSGQNMGGLGVKRCQVNNGYPSNFTFNGTGGDSKAAVIANPGSYNGNIGFDTDGYITIYQALESD